MSAPPKHLTIGVRVPCRDLRDTLDGCRGDGNDFIVVPLVHPRYKRRHLGVQRNEPLTRSDLLLSAAEWNNFVIGELSPWINLDAASAKVRRDSLLAFKQELAWATHISVGAVVLPEIPVHAVNYSRACLATLQQATYLQMIVRVPLVSPAGDMEGFDASNGRPMNDSWERWNALREQCNYHNHLCVALVLTADVPARTSWERWVGEPVQLVYVPTSIFTLNSKGRPVLSKAHQVMLFEFFRHKDMDFVVTGSPLGQEGGLLRYVEYMNYLWGKKPKWSEREVYEHPYFDYLQTPLQPLADNLESQTYEVFEQDPVKYREYESAVLAALLARDQELTTVYVVGAGRGPLVRASLRAAERANKKIRVFAVEKNQNAVVTLLNAKVTEKWDNVEIIPGDMRSVKRANNLADIMVSELLGSFGDNELSPECLDGAMEYLKPDGVSIPADYTSFLAPITSHRLWNEVRTHSAGNNEYAAFTSHSVGFETGYVVRLHDFAPLGESKPCFFFEHPNPQRPIDNTREITLTWTAQESATLHGFAGYFETTLFGDVMLSINPPTFSEGMFSWFPIYFPIKKPFRVAKGDSITINMWRLVNDKKVWYEWSVTSPQNSTIHNLNGSSYWIGL